MRLPIDDSILWISCSNRSLLPTHRSDQLLIINRADFLKTKVTRCHTNGQFESKRAPNSLLLLLLIHRFHSSPLADLPCDAGFIVVNNEHPINVHPIYVNPPAGPGGHALGARHVVHPSLQPTRVRGRHRAVAVRPCLFVITPGST